MIDKRKKLFEGRYCQLEKADGFVLNGIVIEVTSDGIIFHTKQSTSFIAWNQINQLLPVREP